MKFLRWFIGALGVGLLGYLITFHPLPFLFNHELPYVSAVGRVLYLTIVAAFFCLYRLWKGPTGADRIVAIDMLGIMIVGYCALLTITTGRSWYMDIGIAWAIQSFITTLACAKFLEGKSFDE
jgi:multicomponent Na+:H+ antiporter subunit F